MYTSPLAAARHPGAVPRALGAHNAARGGGARRLRHRAGGHLARARGSARGRGAQGAAARGAACRQRPASRARVQGTLSHTSVTDAKIKNICFIKNLKKYL